MSPSTRPLIVSGHNTQVIKNTLLLQQMPVLLCVLFLQLCLSQPGYAVEQPAGEPELHNIIVTASSTHLLAFATVRNGFTPQMMEGLHNGIPLEFTFYLKLSRTKPFWFDETLERLTISHTLRYDSLQQKYAVNRSEKPDHTIMTNDLDFAMELMTKISNIQVIRHEELISGEHYGLHIKVSLEKNALPKSMHYIFPLTSLWSFETDWRSIEFRY